MATTWSDESRTERQDTVGGGAENRPKRCCAAMRISLQPLDAPMWVRGDVRAESVATPPTATGGIVGVQLPLAAPTDVGAEAGGCSDLGHVYFRMRSALNCVQCVCAAVEAAVGLRDVGVAGCTMG